MRALELIAQSHSKWIEIVTKLGETNYAEDIVQETYLRISKYDDDVLLMNGQPNGALMFTILRNMFLIYQRHGDTTQRKPIQKVYLDEIIDMAYGDNIEKEEAYGKFLEQLDELTWSWDKFDRKMYQLHVGTYGTQNVEGHGDKRSYRRIENESTISLTTIYKTMERCQDSIRENLRESWEDFNNEDYELI